MKILFFCILMLLMPFSGKAQSRCWQYKPDGQDFVCVNGSNRYTRALYGSNDDDRIETSDRPVFVAYKKNDSRNISFCVTVDGKKYPLDSTSYCEARYSAARRTYYLKDKAWGNATLRLCVLALPASRGGIWRFEASGFASSSVTVSAVSCDIANQRLNRWGDMRAEKPGSLEASPLRTNLDTVSSEIKTGEVLYVLFDGKKFSAATSTANDCGKRSKASLHNVSMLERLYDEAEAHRLEIAGRVRVSTPDPYLNTLGGALVAAADGTWDGDTFLHGAIAWRSQLPGWRGAYAGDFLGWEERARRHFTAYAESQVTNVPCVLPHPQQDSTKNLCRAARKWGTPMYSNGYICRKPHQNNLMHHYDMNLNYVDELLWHLSFNADTAFMRSIFPVIKRHLAWEKLNFDPDDDALYDACAAIWASDGLYYNGGAATHSTAYNYRSNRLAARIAEILGEDAAPYRREAERILSAMNKTLWVDSLGCWAEYKDRMGLQRLHTSAALWSVYTPIDSKACSVRQAYLATRYIDSCIPHIPIIIDGKDSGLQTLSTSNWMPYCWSTNNVAEAEVMHTALAYFHAGRNDEAFALMKADLLDEMYLGASPGNIGQISTYDAARGETYRDFADNVGITAKTLIEGLYGIQPDALYGRCYIRPGFPSEWDSASIVTPYIEYSFRREGGKDVFDITQKFKKPLQIVIRQNTSLGGYKDTPLSSDITMHVELDTVAMAVDNTPTLPCSSNDVPQGNDFSDVDGGKCRTVNMDKLFNASIPDVFENEYTSPAPPFTTLRMPKNGFGEWCHPMERVHLNDSVFRQSVTNGVFTAVLPDGARIPFRSPAKGRNIVYTSLWDNYPDSVAIPLKGKASHAYILMAGTTNQMQSRIDNALVTVEYADGSRQILPLRNPDNWCPAEQDYYYDDYAFRVTGLHPMRVHFMSGCVSRNLGKELGIEGVYGRRINGGAGQILDMRLNPHKKLRSLTLRTLSNDVVAGIIALTLQ